MPTIFMRWCVACVTSSDPIASIWLYVGQSIQLLKKIQSLIWLFSLFYLNSFNLGKIGWCDLTHTLLANSNEDERQYHMPPKYRAICQRNDDYTGKIITFNMISNITRLCAVGYFVLFALSLPPSHVERLCLFIPVSSGSLFYHFKFDKWCQNKRENNS